MSRPETQGYRIASPAFAWPVIRKTIVSWCHCQQNYCNRIRANLRSMRTSTKEKLLYQDLIRKSKACASYPAAPRHRDITTQLLILSTNRFYSDHIHWGDVTSRNRLKSGLWNATLNFRVSKPCSWLMLARRSAFVKTVNQTVYPI